MKLFFTSVFLCCYTWLFAAGAGSAQASVGLVGNIKSVSQQLLANAAILVVHEPSGTRRTAASDMAGNFAIGGLAVGGPYTIQITQPNYQTEVVRNVFLLAGQTANGTFVMHPVGEAATADARPAAAAGPTSSHSAAPVPGYYPYTYIKQCRIIEPTVAAAPARATPTPKAAAPEAAAPARSAPAYVRRPTPRVEPPSTKGHYDAATGNYIYDTGAPTVLKLPNGQKITGVGVYSTETTLHSFITNSAVKVDTVDLTKGWMSFDRVYFETGKATLTKSSMSQLRNIVTLLQSYPNARLKIGGYTDSTGTYKVNRQLSEARARTAWAALVEMGVRPARIEARGYGSNYPIASNQTVEGRAMNRRLSVKVLSK